MKMVEYYRKFGESPPMKKEHKPPTLRRAKSKGRSLKMKSLITIPIGTILIPLSYSTVFLTLPDLFKPKNIEKSLKETKEEQQIPNTIKRGFSLNPLKEATPKGSLMGNKFPNYVGSGRK